MSLFSKKKQPKPSPFPPDTYEPVLRSSICTGETTACFRNRETGKLHEVVVIRDQSDLQEFGRQYGVDVEHLKRVY